MFGKCLANKTYTISFDVLETNGYAVRLRFNNGSNIITWSAGSLVVGNRYSHTYTPTEDGSFNFNTGNVAFTGSIKVFDNVMVEEGSTASDWAPYENICPIYPANGKNLLTKRTQQFTHVILTLHHGVIRQIQLHMLSLVTRQCSIQCRHLTVI